MASMTHMKRTKAGRAYAAPSIAKKLWAIACVVGFTAFWTYGFIALAGIFGERSVHPMTVVLCAAGLAVGIAGWRKVMSFAPAMHGRRAAARARLEEEYRQSEHQG